MSWAKSTGSRRPAADVGQGARSTAADRDDYLRSGLCPIRCGHCGAGVLVEKNSPQHTRHPRQLSLL
ncbi:hypothetical protein [Saccharopolyspora hattusasensis]|uniref:hypothetical protein n=1 Tax=Saccharopolyspora hattusasensis TaxID=1128679 RepID=UPI003D9947AF